jgi:hypothetical protein
MWNLLVRALTFSVPYMRTTADPPSPLKEEKGTETQVVE